jgi:hypothetical protein
MASTRKTAQLFSAHLGEKLSRVSFEGRLVLARLSRISDGSEITAYKPTYQDLRHSHGRDGKASERSNPMKLS